MNVIFLKCVLATLLGVPGTNSKQMASLARIQKATASWGNVPPGMASALNCSIRVRQHQWMPLVLIAIISLSLSYAGGKMENDAIWEFVSRYYLASLLILPFILIIITSNNHSLSHVGYGIFITFL